MNIQTEAEKKIKRDRKCTQANAKKHAKREEGAASTPDATGATATAGYFSTAATAREGTNTKFTFTPQPE